MRVALAVGRSRTISGAAGALKVDHTTVGRKLAALEDELGAPLFVREANRLRPTRAGEAVLRAAERMEQAMLDLDRTLAARAQTPSGVVRVTTSEAFAGVLVRSLPGLRVRHPELRVEVLAGNRPLDLARGEADLAIRFVETVQPTLVCKRVLALDWALFAAEDYLAEHGLPTEDTFAEHRFVGFGERLAESPGGRWIASHVPADQIVMRADSILAARMAAITAMGLAALPVFVSIDQPGLRRALEAPVGQGTCWIVVHEGLRKVPRIRAVMDYLEAHILENAELLGGTRTGHP